MVILRRMTEPEYLRFKAYSIHDYAKDLMDGQGLGLEQALEEARKEHEAILPDGRETKDQSLMTVTDAQSSEAVGGIWFFYEARDGVRRVWLCDFVIDEAKRRKGYATAALAEMERMAKADGCTESVLFVWDHNPAGYGLYQKCGYAAIRRGDGGSVMKKSL